MLLFDIGLSPRFKYAALVQQNREQAITQLEDTVNKINAGPHKNKIAFDNLEIGRGVFRKEIEENSRQNCWHQIRLFEKVLTRKFPSF